MATVSGLTSASSSWCHFATSGCSGYCLSFWICVCLLHQQTCTCVDFKPLTCCLRMKQQCMPVLDFFVLSKFTMCFVCGRKMTWHLMFWCSLRTDTSEFCVKLLVCCWTHSRKSIIFLPPFWLFLGWSKFVVSVSLYSYLLDSSSVQIWSSFFFNLFLDWLTGWWSVCSRFSGVIQPRYSCWNSLKGGSGQLVGYVERSVYCSLSGFCFAWPPRLSVS